MKCNRCGYESYSDFTRCPSCGTVQSYRQNPAPSVAAGKGGTKRSAGEAAAIVISVIVFVLGIIASIVIFSVFTTNLVRKAFISNEFGMDAFDDFDSNEYDDIEDFFNKYYNNKNKDDDDSSTGLNTPITFTETLRSFSAGDIETEYEVSMVDCYRGEAALKLLEGAALPLYDDERNDIYLVKFKVKITQQDNDAIVIIPAGHPTAYPSNTLKAFSAGYSYIESLPYTNSRKLVSKNDETEVWHAFIVSKEDTNPMIRWNYREDKVFRNPNEAISDASLVESGAAIEIIESAESESSADTSPAE